MAAQADLQHTAGKTFSAVSGQTTSLYAHQGGIKAFAASQAKLDQPGFDKHLEGGWDQVIFKPKPSQLDTTRYYMRGGGHGEKLHPPA